MKKGRGYSGYPGKEGNPKVNSDHKQTEEALRESEHRYRSLFENMIDGYAYCQMIFENDQPQDFVYLAINRSFETLTGLKDVAGKKVTEVIPRIRETNPELFEIYGRVALTGQAERFETYLAPLKIWFSISVYSMEKGTFTAVFENITERKQAEEGLRRNDERLKRSQEIAHLGSWELDLVNNILSWSDEVYRIFGLKPQEFGATYEAFLEVIHPDDRAAVDDAYSGSVSEGRDAYEIEHRVVRKSSGEIRYVHEKCTHVRDESGKIIRSIGMVHDITERQKAEEDLKRRTIELEVANKELEAFSYSVSHDLRTPLRTLDGFSQAVIEEYGDKLDEQGKDYLYRVRNARQKMSDLINDLLKLSHLSLEEMHFQSVNLGEIAQSILEELKHNQPERKAEIVIFPGIIAVGDQSLLTIALQNLLGNAWKFTGKCPQARIELGVTGQNGETVYFIRDNGAGFNMRYRDKLFQPFQRLHSASEYEGTGIGLAIVQRVIRRHGGRVWAESEKGKGATFYFTLG